MEFDGTVTEYVIVRLFLIHSERISPFGRPEGSLEMIETLGEAWLDIGT